MGLLPIFLTLTLFIFLWGLVNYHSFITKRDTIQQLAEAVREWTHQSQEMVRELTDTLTRAHSIDVPDYLRPTHASSGITRENEKNSEVLDKWQQFVRQYPILQQDVPLQQLLHTLTESIANQQRAQTRLHAAVADYNQHRLQMPYRLIALLFGFRPVTLSA